MMHRVPGRQTLGLPVLSMMPHQCALPSVAGAHEKVARDGDPFAIDQEANDFTTILHGLDEFFRRLAIFLAAAGNADPVFVQRYNPFPDR